jgi:Uma2 family endonuclease
MTTAITAIPKSRAKIKSDFVSLEKYFQAEEMALHKSEYDNGKIIKMAGGTTLHDNLAMKAAKLIDDFVENNDLAYIVNGSETKIRIEAYNKVVYPDALVIMEKPIYYNDRNDTIINPLIVVEVLSKGTARHDRTLKFDYYRSIESFKEYVLIDQNKKRVSVFSKQEDKTWILRDYEGDDAIAILYALHQCPIALKRLYRNLEILAK